MLTSVNASTAAYAGGMKTTALGGTALGNLAALQAAMNTGRNVHIPYGSYPLAPGALYKGLGQRVFGQGPQQTVLVIDGSGDVFHANSMPRACLEDLQVSGDAAATSGFVFSIDGSGTNGGSSAQAAGGLVRNVLMIGAYNGIGIRDVNHIDVQGVRMQGMRGDFGIWADSDHDDLRTDLIDLDDVMFSSHPSVRAIRGTALYVNGFVHTISMRVFRAVNPYRGILIEDRRSAGFGRRPAFIYGDIVEIDFPYMDGIAIVAGDVVKLANGYVHGSVTETGIVIGHNVVDFKASMMRITGHAKCGLYTEAVDNDLMALQMDENGLGAHATHSGILLGPSSRNVRIVGGGGRNTAVALGINRASPATNVQAVCIDDHQGVLGPRNF